MDRETDRGYRERPRQMRESWTHTQRIQRDTETDERSRTHRQRIQRDNKTDERELDTHTENTERDREERVGQRENTERDR